MLKGLLSLFLKPHCPLCERMAEDCLCSYCQKQLNICKSKDPCHLWRGDLPLFVWGEYGGKLKQAIASIKYENHPELGELMGYWLGETWLSSTLFSRNKKLIVVPIPLHENKQKERGFNQAELMARGFCQVTGYPLLSQGLKRIKDTQAMFELTPQEREINIKNAFELGKDLQKRPPSSPVLLLDDIYTRGTTVREAQKVLRSHKIPVFGVVALAKPPHNS